MSDYPGAIEMLVVTFGSTRLRVLQDFPGDQRVVIPCVTFGSTRLRVLQVLLVHDLYSAFYALHLVRPVRGYCKLS